MYSSAVSIVSAFLLTISSIAWAQSGNPKLLALVIGNAAYTAPGDSLNGPEADASDMSKALTKLGFEVTNADRVVNLNRNAMFTVIENFAKRLDSNTIAVLYYSGHGLEDNNKNYLVPTDAAIKTFGDLDTQLVPLDKIIERLEQRETRTKIIILDACRNLPSFLRYKSLGQKAGLARVMTDLRDGTRVVYSASPNKPSMSAPTGQRNSVFTSALLKAMDESPSTIDKMLLRAAELTVRSTSERQVPWSTGTIFLSVDLGPPVQGNPLSQTGTTMLPGTTKTKDPSRDTSCQEISEQVVDNGVSTWVKKCV